jgi:hypothetical protein
VGWIIFYAQDAYSREYPTQTSITSANVGTWAVKTLNGNTNNGVLSWTMNLSGRFGSLYVGSGSAATGACSYYNGSNYYSGVGGGTVAAASTCSTWVR